MVCDARHKAQTITQGLHSAISFEYANESARLAGGPFESFDKNKLALQTDDNSIWLLVDEVAETWIQINQSATIILNDNDGYISSVSDSTNDAGVIDLAARADHQHAHGDRGGGSLHELATSLQAGFFSSDGYLKLDGIEDGAQVNTVDSVFGRTGAVIALSGDYDSDLIDNVSTVTGASVSDALEYLDGYVNDGIVGGDLSGTLPNPQVVDLTISGEQQGSILYFDGSNWVQLPPGTDGYVLTTQGTGDNPEWTSVSSVGAGDVIGPASSTDNALVRWDGITGKFIQNSNATLTDAGALTLTLGLTTGGDIDVGGNSITNVSLVDGVDVSAHASRHEFGGADTIEIANLSTSETDTTLVLKPDGAGSVSWVVDQVRDLDGYVFEDRQVIAGTGLVGGGDLSADRTFDVVANADGSIVVNANDIQVGTLANDAQHGDLGGGSLHELADSTQAGFFSIDGYNKLEGIEAGAQVNTVDSVFGRTGAVIALASDYDASQIDNDSTVPGAFVDDALDYLDGYISSVATDFDSHADRHEFGGADQIDGYELELTYSPSNYTPPVNNKLGEHISAIDDALAGAAFGDVVGPASSTDNAIARFDGTTGKLIQNSGVTIDDSGNLDMNSNEIQNPSIIDFSGGTAVTGFIRWASSGFTLRLLDVAGKSIVAFDSGAADEVSLGSTSNLTTEVIASSDVELSAGGNLTAVFDTDTATSLAAAGDGYVLTWNATTASIEYVDPSVVGVTDHGDLAGLGDDDHTQYLLVDGTRAMSGNLDMGGNSITNVNLVDGVDVSNHGNRHNPGGADPVTTAAATGLDADSTNTEGVATSLARSDHTHAIDTTGTLSTIEGGDTASDGVASGLARKDHQHAVSTGAASSISVGDSATEGTSTDLARADHLHTITAGTPVAIGNANAQGSSGNFVHSDHVHQLGGTVGGDLSGTLPNPTVTDLTISGEEQGSILYFDGSNWTQLPPGTDGYVLTTNGTGANPEWADVDSVGAGDVIGPASSTDNALVRFDGTSGKFIQNSNATLTDAGALTLTLGLITGGDIDVGGNSITNVNLVDGVDVSAHADRHEFGGADQIDGYDLELTYSPSNYDAPVNNKLGEHIASIDESLESLDTSLTNVYYVDQNGDDTTGDGSISNPFATVSRAMTEIGDASTTSEFENYNLATFEVILGPGSYVENVTIPRRQYINISFNGSAQIVGDITYTADTSLGASSHPPRLTLSGETGRPGFGTAVQTVGVDGSINFGDDSLTQHVAILELNEIYVTGDVICGGNISEPNHTQLFIHNASIQGGVYHTASNTGRLNIYAATTDDRGSLTGIGSIGLVGRSNAFRFRSLIDVYIPGNVEADGALDDWRMINVEFGGSINLNGSTATIYMDLVTYNSYLTALSGTDTSTINILDAHASLHQFGGIDQIDGYELELTYTPSNYNTPTNDKLGEHIAAIDEALATAGAGDVVGPASSTDNALARFDGTTGKLIQNSNATLTDAGALTLTLGLTTGGDIDVGGNNITNVNLVDGVDVSNHGSRHDPGGADPVTTAAATGLDADSTNTEGTATSLARSDHTHAIDTTGTLSTIDAGDTASDGVASGLSRKDHQHAVSTGTSSTISVGDSATEGTSTDLARADHLHTVTAGSPVAVGDSNQTGSSGNFVHSDHVHQLGGSVGGDLAGTLPNPTVTDLTITNEQQGSILYFDGTGWEALDPGDDGYVLTTNGTGADPTWEQSSTKRVIIVEFTLTEDVNNTVQWFTTWRSHGGDSPGTKRSGTSAGIQNANTCSPFQVPFDATITKAVLTLKGAGVQNGSVTYPVSYETDLYDEGFTSETKVADIDFSISSSFTVGTFSVGNTNYKGSTSLNIDVSEAQLLALKFINGTGPSVVGQTRNAFVTLVLEER